MTAKITRSGLRLPVELNKKLGDIAAGFGISKNALILQILWEYVRKNKSEG